MPPKGAAYAHLNFRGAAVPGEFDQLQELVGVFGQLQRQTQALSGEGGDRRLDAGAIERQFGQRPMPAKQCLRFRCGNDAAAGCAAAPGCDHDDGVAGGKSGGGPGILDGQVDPGRFAADPFVPRIERFDDAGNMAKHDPPVLGDQGGPALADHAIAAAEKA